MRTTPTIALSALAAARLGIAAANAADVVPCEDVLAELRTAKAAATVNDDVRAKVEALEAKGVERCNADDDRRADAFFAEAIEAMGE